MSETRETWDELDELFAFRRAMARGEYQPDNFDLLVKAPTEGRP